MPRARAPAAPESANSPAWVGHNRGHARAGLPDPTPDHTRGPGGAARRGRRRARRGRSGEGEPARAIARRVGITHQSVAHHFADRRALFTAVAVQRFDTLHAEHTRALEQLPGNAPLGEAVATLGQVCVRFARDHSAAVGLMMGSRLVDNKAPELVAARTAWELHMRTVSDAADDGWGGGVPAISSRSRPSRWRTGWPRWRPTSPPSCPTASGSRTCCRWSTPLIITPPRHDS